MSDLRDRRKLPHVEVTAATLKWYGCATMFFYSLSMTVVQNGLLHVSQFSNARLREMWAADPDLMALSSWAAVFQLLGVWPSRCSRFCWWRASCTPKAAGPT